MKRHQTSARLAIASVIVLASCATTADYKDVLGSWAGAPEAELVRDWGRPLQSYEAGGRKFIVYESRRTLHLPGTAPIYTSAGPAGGSPAMDVEMSCTTTFELANSKVISWSYKGNDCGERKSAPSRA
jgi:hypothetical protein